MNLYATMAAAAARLTPFSPPAPIANPGALARLYELIGSVSETVGSFAAPATKNLPSKLWTLLTKGTYPLTAARISSIPVEYVLAFVEGSNMGQMMGNLAMRSLTPTLKGPLELLPNAVRPAVSATLGNADTIGGCRCPPAGLRTNRLRRWPKPSRPPRRAVRREPRGPSWDWQAWPGALWAPSRQEPVPE